MKILMLVNWKINYCSSKPKDKQPPDYFVKGEDYWFYRYFMEKPEVDVVDISSFAWLEKLEKNKVRFYIWQTLKSIPQLHKYDLIVSHGMQSGVVLCLWRKLFKSKAKHIVFDIGSFNSAAESGIALKLMQFASRSLDGIIYHTSSQKEYYEKKFPWILEKSKFIRFGADLEFFNSEAVKKTDDYNKYIICVGYSKRDWDTLVKAFSGINSDITLRMIGHVDEKYKKIARVEQLPYIPVKELMNQIYNAKFCVLPLESFNYSYGQMTLMQQMSLEKCVVTARVPSLIDYVVDNETAILYEPQNKNDLQKKMEQLIDNPDLIRKIGINGKKYLIEYCNEKTMAHEIENFFKKKVN